MARVKYDVSDVEPSQDQDFDTPIPKGLYIVEVADADYGAAKSSGRMQFKLELDVVKDSKTGSTEYKSRKLWDYIGTDEPSEWKLRQMIDAFGLKPKGAIDPSVLIGKKLMVRVKHQNDEEYGLQARVGSLLALSSRNGDEAEAEEPEAEAEVGDDAGDDDDDTLTYADLEEYDREDLEAVIEENDLDDVPFNTKTKDDVLRERIAEALGLEPESESGAEDGEAEDYSEWELGDIKAELKERGLSAKGPRTKLVKRLEESDAEGDGDGDGDQPF